MIATLIVSALLVASPEEHAIGYLAREVPRWSPENRCYSCHNNGDAARALYVATRAGYSVPAGALSDTTAWLLRPEDWDNNRGDPAFSDKKLAGIQFAAALAAAVQTGVVTDRAALRTAAESLLPYQESDGSWRVDAESEAGSPVTYGPYVASWLVRRTLIAAGAAEFDGAIARVDRWFREANPAAIPDIAAVILALDGHRPQLVEKLRRAQASDGGWGPFAGAPSEPYDSALALLALAAVKRDDVTPAVRKGRDFLIRAQLPSGAWTETTRPPGGRSYAQHVSTSGWATLALITAR